MKCTIEEIHFCETRCLMISNGIIDVVVSIDFGPRILFYGYKKEQNLFYVFKDQISHPNKNEWNIYGGHRLWVAPEDKNLTYHPDNAPLTYTRNNDTIVFEAPIEKETRIQKVIEITLHENSTEVVLDHKIINHNLWDIELSAWALSVMNTGGTAIIPQEEFKAHPNCLAPARPLVLWHFTDMSDPRFTWGKDYIQVKQDNSYSEKIKIGVCNTKGREAYILGNTAFVKQHSFDTDAVYPDMGCNAEFFTMPDFLEMETLSPLMLLSSGEEVCHQEIWTLEKYENVENIDIAAVF